MIQTRYLVGLGALAASLAACGSTIEGPAGGSGAMSGTAGTPPATGGSVATGGTGGSATGGTAGSSTGGSTTGGAGGSMAGTGAGGSGGVTTCVPGVPASTQIPRLRNTQYDDVMNDLLGVTTLASAGNGTPSSLLAEDSGGAMTDIGWSAYQNAANKLATEVMAGPNRAKFISCDPAMPACLTSTIQSFGRKAFRRPLTDAEVAAFETLTSVTPAGTPEQMATAILYTFLASPSFIMIPELAQDTEAGAIKLSSFEVAARLSFFLWNSVPDDALNTAADNGLLATSQQILEQAQRMVLVRAKAAPVVSAFHRAYADIRLGSHWDSIDHDTTTYPKYSPAVRTAMMKEIDAFFENVAFQDGSFKDLFLSSAAYVNADTAAIYGLDPAAYGPELTRVALDANQRPGFLTRVGFLSSFSSPGTSSPLLRGAYLTRSILGIHIDDPPADASKTPIPPGTYTTYRQAMEALTAGPKCAGCHAPLINPPGFVLEHFDSIGEWQDTDRMGGAIDGTANVMFSEDRIETITSPLELMTEIGTGPEAQHLYAERWVSFATGRVPNPNDACEVNTLSARLAQNGYRILDLVTDLTQAESFRLRTVGN